MEPPLPRHATRPGTVRSRGEVEKEHGRFAGERGYSLVEMLVTVSLLGVVLAAIISVSVNSKDAAAGDNERNLTTQDANKAIYGMTTLLRQASFVHLSDTSCPSGTVPANCIDFNVPARTVVPRNTSTGALTGTPTRSTARVRIDCSSGACIQTTNASGTGAPTSPSATLITGLQNSAVTGTGGALNPVFDYKIFNTGSNTWASTTLTFSMTSLGAAGATPVAWIHVTLATARKGTRRRGLKGNIYLQDGVELRNLNTYESNPCSPMTGGTQTFC